MHIHGTWPGYPESKIWFVRCFTYVPMFMMFFCAVAPQSIQLTLGGDLSVILNILTLAHIPIGIALVKLIAANFNHSGMYHAYTFILLLSYVEIILLFVNLL